MPRMWAAVAAALMVVALPSAAAAQERPWQLGATVGWAGFVDDATKHYVVVGAALRRALTPRLRVGPQVLLMTNDGNLTDRWIVVGGDLMYDLRPDTGARVVPFVAAGGGLLAGRDQVNNGPYWHRGVLVEGGAGVRARVGSTAALAAEYRIGSELYQRVSGSVMVQW